MIYSYSIIERIMNCAKHQPRYMRGCQSRRIRVTLAVALSVLVFVALGLPVLAGNTVTVSGEIVGSPGPHADFSASPLTGNPPLLVKFSDKSTGTITSWAWDFQNDGTIDRRTRNPYFLYTRAGTYTVSLTVSGPEGTDSEVKTGYITVGSGSTGKKPLALYTQDKYFGITPLTVRFTDRSRDNPTEYLWNFADGCTSTEQNPIHTYASAGVYTVHLKVSNPYGSNTARSMVIVLDNLWWRR